VEDESSTLVRTFLIADIRGYTRFTEQHGDEASAKLTLHAKGTYRIVMVHQAPDDNHLTLKIR
jgi:class 3 adenylate cyclase